MSNKEFNAELAIAILQSRIEQLEQTKYNGWLNSTNIIKRSIAVWWHFMLGYLLILIPIFILAFIVWVLSAI